MGALAMPKGFVAANYKLIRTVMIAKIIYFFNLQRIPHRFCRKNAKKWGGAATLRLRPLQNCRLGYYLIGIIRFCTARRPLA